MTVQRVKVVRSLFHANDRAAEAIRARCDAAGVVAVNLLAGPGAGKTSLITRTIAALAGTARVGVVEGDIAGSVDTERVLAAGAVDAVQVNTGGGCHLEAGMLARALEELDLGAFDLLMVENVGNLICPTHWDLGEHARVCLVSAAEGDDKPVKYPDVFARSDAIVLNKIDLIDLVDFDRARFYEAVRALNPDAPVFEVSCRTSAGLGDWGTWLRARLASRVAGGEVG